MEKIIGFELILKGFFKIIIEEIYAFYSNNAENNKWVSMTVKFI